MNKALMSLVTIEEVKQAVFQMRATEAQRPDGLNNQFCHHHWEDIQQDVFRMVESFFDLGTLNHILDITRIVLISKVSNPESITQYRSISLYNFSYKVISKVMVNCLKHWLLELIATKSELENF